MDKLQQIIAIVSAGLGLLITLTSLIIPLVKNVKAKKALQALNLLAEEIKPLITKAEEFTHYSGEEKKEYVMTQATKFALEHGIKFDAESISRQIEALVSLTKAVNKREKDIPILNLSAEVAL